ncbi:MAG: hypothetical protein ACK4NX_01015 [Candidatus Paceibacteria bacterium]
MTVLSPTKEHIIATTFSGNYFVKSRQYTVPKIRRHSLRKLELEKVMVFFAFLSFIAFILMLIIGIDSVRLSFLIQSARKEYKELVKINESLALEVSELRAPEVLTQKAKDFGLIQPQEVHYVTYIEREIVAEVQRFSP